MRDHTTRAQEMAAGTVTLCREGNDLKGQDDKDNVGSMVRTRTIHGALISGILVLALGLVRLISENHPWPYERLLDVFGIMLGVGLIWRHFRNRWNQRDT